jgi:predicted XRE-type DNA-binding protein
MEENFTTKDNLVNKYGFTEADFTQIAEHGIDLNKIEAELLLFQSGIPKVNLESPAKIDDGILKLTTDEFQSKANFFDQKKSDLKLKKFVPASGAASRMFKFLNEFLNDFNPDNETINAYINRRKDKNLPIFLAGIEKFPFFEVVKSKVKTLVPDYYSLESHEKSYHFIKTMLSSEYFDFSNKPKGVLDFHKYATHIATPVEEHLNECAFYAASNGASHLHFTISENHEELFHEIVNAIKIKIEENTKTNLQVSYSYQQKSTDTIAVDTKNKPFRDENNQLVFRPGGHGALINNLNSLDADIIFIKNIDNVIQNHVQEIALYKKGLAGVLLELQEEIFKILHFIDQKNFHENEVESVVKFMKSKLNIKVREDFDKFTFEHKIEFIKTKLNRPIRVCGMVKNEGEPGGGPFWIRNSKGNLSLQIIESSQVDTNDFSQNQILSKATHFNPVDLVCATKDYQGNKFDLTEFVDHATGFIVQKNNKGKELKGYELPGLWNGAMAKWISVFVEVPLVTFNPVKTVNDLLKPAHQPRYEN